MAKGIGTMDQHESKDRVEFKEQQDYEPTHKEEVILKRVNRLFDKARRKRTQYDEKWIDYYHMFRGKQWKEERPPYRHSEVINMIFQNIQSVIPIMTDSKPKVEFLPQNPEDSEVVAILNEMIKDDWDRNNWLSIITEALYDGHIYGTSITETGYDPDAKDGLGSVTFKTKDPLFCYPDPDATDINVESEFFINAEPMAVSKIKKRWPSKGKFVKPDVDDFATIEKADMGKIKLKSPTENVVAFQTSAVQRDKGEDRALVITCYLKDDSVLTEKVTEKDKDTDEEKAVEKKRKKYPNGRRIIIANKVILQDGNMPFDDGEFPFEKYVNYMLPREFWGESEVAQLESPQKIFNKLISFTLDVLTLMGNPIWILDRTSGVDSSNLFNSPGLIVEKEPGSEVRREAGTQLQPYVMQLVDRMKSWFDDISGVNEVSRGATPTGVQAGIAIQSLQDAAQTRIRQKSRNLDAMLQRVGQHYLSRVLQFYTAPRVIRLTNNQSAVKYFKISMDNKVNESGATAQRDLVVVPFSEEGGKMVAGDQMRFDMIRNFDVRVQTGSGLPFARAEKESKLLQFFDRGLIDREEVLKNSDLPNWEAILKRIEDKEQAAAQAEQAAQQQGA